MTGPDGRRATSVGAHLDLRSLWTFAPSPPRLWVGVRAALVVGIPLVVGTLLGQGTTGFLASLGGFAVLYGTGAAIVHRARVVAGVGAGLCVCALAGVLTAGRPWATLVAMVLLTAIASWALHALRVGTPGGFFFALTTGVAGLAADGSGQGLVLIMSVLGALLALTVGISDILVRADGVEREWVGRAAREVGSYAAAVEAPDEDEGGELGRLRQAASSSLHAAWTAVNDGMARERYADELRRITETYVGATAERTGRRITQEVHPWSTDPDGGGGPLLGPGSAYGRSEDEQDRVDAAQVRQSALGRPDAAYLLRQAAWWPSESLLVGARVLVATAVAGSIATVLGNEHVYWAVAFATLVVSTGGSRRVQLTKALHRVIGTTLGLGVFAVLLSLDPRDWWLIGIVVLLQGSVELVVTRNYALAVTCLTPLALTISAEVTGMPTETVVGDRVLDTAIGVGTALVVLVVSGLGGQEIVLRAHARRAALAVDEVLADLVEGTHATPEGERRRQHLYAELLASDNVARRALSDAPAHVGPYRGMERLLSDVGYLVLGAAWHDRVAADRQRFVRARQALAQVIDRPVWRRRPAADITAELREVEQALTRGRGEGS